MENYVVNRNKKVYNEHVPNVTKIDENNLFGRMRPSKINIRIQRNLRIYIIYKYNIYYIILYIIIYNIYYI